MLESGSSGSVRGVPSNGHPYRDPRPLAAVRNTRRDRLRWWEAVIRFPAIDRPRGAYSGQFIFHRALILRHRPVRRRSRHQRS